MSACNKVFNAKAFIAQSTNRVPLERMKGLDSEQGVDQTTVAHINFRRLHQSLSCVG